MFNSSTVQDSDIQELARRYGTNVAQVREIMKRTGSYSRKQLERALEREFSHVSNPT